MANKSLFQSSRTPLAPAATSVNNAGGKAYELSDKTALAQIAATNCFNGTFYVSSESLLETAKNAALKLKSDPQFIAKCAIYARHKANMKDMPAFLMAILADVDTALFRKLFPVVIDNGKMLRNFVQIARSGATGRKFNMSAGACRRAIQAWFDVRTPEQVFKASVGNDPSMADILKMARPRSCNAKMAAMLAYLIGKPYIAETGEINAREPIPASSVPQIIRDYEAFKATKSGPVPKVDFRMLDSLGLNDAHWVEIARNAPWFMTRMNLNTFARHNVFKDDAVTALVAKRLADPDEIRRAKGYPYQLMSAYIATQSNADVPPVIREALQDAMEIATANVPDFPARTAVAVDTSGSMSSSITGHRAGATSAVSCVQVAALFASCVIRKQKLARVLPFDTSVHNASSINPRDTVMTNAGKLAKYGGGGTDCSVAIKQLNAEKWVGDAIVFVSDNESWVDRGYYGRGTGMMTEWLEFKRRNPAAKLVCIDLTPGTTSQTAARQDILQVGGFGDAVFDVVASFLTSADSSAEHWVKVIESVSLDVSPEPDTVELPEAAD